MITPFANLNAATIRAEARARARRRMADTACLVLLALIAIGVADMILTTATGLDDLLAQAAARKGM